MFILAVISKKKYCSIYHCEDKIDFENGIIKIYYDYKISQDFDLEKIPIPNDCKYVIFQDDNKTKINNNKKIELPIALEYIFINDDTILNFNIPFGCNILKNNYKALQSSFIRGLLLITKYSRMCI